MIQDNQQSRFIQQQNEEGGRGEERREWHKEFRERKVPFISTDDTFIQSAHNHPSSHPVIKHYAALRTHAPCSPSHFLSKHALVLHCVEVFKQRLKVMALNVY